jgi:phytoene dehydrogenase-like protein
MGPPDLPESSIEGISAPASVRTSSFRELEQLQQQQDFDYIVIGSGIGGLSAAAMLSQCYKYKVLVLESHYLLGGCAHSFERGGFKFDAGPSLWNGMNSKPYNPLREVMEIVGVGDKVQYADYDGWVMHTPNNVSFKFKVGEGEFEKVIGQYGGHNAMREWTQLNEYLKPIQQLAVAIPPLVLRSDPAVLLTLAPHFGKLLKGAAVASKVEGSFLDVSKDIVNDPFLVNWFEFLSFALSGVPADSTIAAAVAYTMRDLHQKGAKLDYPIGGSAAVVQALAAAITGGAPGSRIIKNAHVGEIDIDARGRAVGVTMKRGGIRIRAKKAVISNASIWDTATLLPASLPAVSDDRRRSELEARLTALKEEKLATPMTNSFVHLHIGINASGLPPDLESHYSVINTWDDIEAPQNHVIISIPSVLDPGLAPDGCHVIHAYAAANEPYDLYSQHDPCHSRSECKSDPQEQEQVEEVKGGGGGGGGSADYIALKADRCDFLWKAIERSIPDVRERTYSDCSSFSFLRSLFLFLSLSIYYCRWHSLTPHDTSLTIIPLPQ